MSFLKILILIYYFKKTLISKQKTKKQKNKKKKTKNYTKKRQTSLKNKTESLPQTPAQYREIEKENGRYHKISTELKKLKETHFKL